VKKLYANGGIKSIYRGTAATLLRGFLLYIFDNVLNLVQKYVWFFKDIPASGIYFSCYEFLMREMTPAGKK